MTGSAGYSAERGVSRQFSGRSEFRLYRTTPTSGSLTFTAISSNRQNPLAPSVPACGNRVRTDADSQRQSNSWRGLSIIWPHQTPNRESGDRSLFRKSRPIAGLSASVRLKSPSARLIGWGGRVRTSAWWNQNPLPYHLATPQRPGGGGAVPRGVSQAAPVYRARGAISSTVAAAAGPWRVAGRTGQAGGKIGRFDQAPLRSGPTRRSRPGPGRRTSETGCRRRGGRVLSPLRMISPAEGDIAGAMTSRPGARADLDLTGSGPVHLPPGRRREADTQSKEDTP